MTHPSLNDVRRAIDVYKKTSLEHKAPFSYTPEEFRKAKATLLDLAQSYLDDELQSSQGKGQGK